MKPGQSITYVEADGTEHAALVAKVYGDEPGPRVLDVSVPNVGLVTGVRHESRAEAGAEHWKLPAKE